MQTINRSHCRSCGLPFGIVEPHSDAPDNCQDCVEKCLPISRQWEARVIQCEDCDLPILRGSAFDVYTTKSTLLPRFVCATCLRNPQYLCLDD